MHLTHVKFVLLVLGLIVMMSCTTKPDQEQKLFPEADNLIEEALNNDLFTGAVLLIGTPEEILHHQAYGFATLYDENLRVVSRPDSMTTGHLFDIASLTKIFATTYGLMALHSDGMIDIDEPISNYLSEFETNTHSEISIRNLLNHTSGLIPWFPTYYVAENAVERRKYTSEQPLDNPPGKVRRYSDLGFMLLGDIIEKASGQPMAEFLNERIYSRVGIEQTGFNPDNTQEIVSTSHGNPFERKMVYDANFGYNIDIDPDSWNRWRNYTLKGEVNDGNAFFTHQGVAGHAGLYSTAEDLFTLLKMVLNDGYHDSELILSPESIKLFTTKDEHNNGLGWGMDSTVIQVIKTENDMLGHTGFTGTNFVINSEAEMMYLLLTNRQHVGVDSTGNYPNLQELREGLSEIVF